MNIFTSLLERARLRSGTHDLLKLDDHLLRDIGMTRADVHALLAGKRRRDGGPTRGGN